ncbi:MAG: hypothetical protein KC474_10630 [Cyanobacteria bacterium HKST-UBA04]|nr:hypothetical protein [Cyanobacteria bacterium HKST-UBA04]
MRPEVPEQGMALWAKLLTASLTALALMVLGVLLGKAWVEFPGHYDDWWYQLLFAARQGGLVEDGTFVASPQVEYRYMGFPQLSELIQGKLWAMTGNIKAVNFVSFAAFLGLLAGLWRLWRVPVFYSVFAMLAVPVLAAQVTLVKNDLIHNVFAVLAVVVAFRLLLAPDHPRRWWLFAFMAMMVAGVTHTKFSMVRVAMVTYGATLLRLVWHDWQACRQTAQTGWVGVMLRRWGLVGLPMVVVSMGLIAYPYLRNLIIFQNPFYPFAFSMLGLTFKGAEPLELISSTTVYFAPQPLRWLYSVIEFGIPPFEWTIDAWKRSTGDYGFRMGGFFAAYVFFHLGLLALNLWHSRADIRRWVLLTMGVVTVTVAFTHQSHELRYVMGWMMLLVAFNGYLIAQGDSTWKGLPSWRIAMLTVYCLGWFLLVHLNNHPVLIEPYTIAAQQVRHSGHQFLHYYVRRLEPDPLLRELTAKQKLAGRRRLGSVKP